MWIKTSLDYGNFEYDSNTNVYFIKQNCFIKAPKNLILNNEKNKTINIFYKFYKTTVFFYLKYSYHIFKCRSHKK